jgi:hypothetical protein
MPRRGEHHVAFPAREAAEPAVGRIGVRMVKAPANRRESGIHVRPQRLSMFGYRQ